MKPHSSVTDGDYYLHAVLAVLLHE